MDLIQPTCDWVIDITTKQLSIVLLPLVPYPTIDELTMIRRGSQDALISSSSSLTDTCPNCQLYNTIFWLRITTAVEQQLLLPQMAIKFRIQLQN